MSGLLNEYLLSLQTHIHLINGDKRNDCYTDVWQVNTWKENDNMILFLMCTIQVMKMGKACCPG